jgi:hypothetical protein
MKKDEEESSNLHQMYCGTTILLVTTSGVHDLVVGLLLVVGGI